MIARMMIAAITVCIGACASSGPDAPAPAATAPPADVSAVTSETSTVTPEGGIHDLDAPGVETTASLAPAEGEDEIVCRREIITGTRMSHRVCRRRADIEAAAEDSQDALRKMRSTGSQLEKAGAN
jgi:hypothetical protein